ncbi:MAG: class I adenylate-forming enzyme family protein [Thermodesulfobacteriota bacterium]
MTLAEQLERNASKTPDKTALIYRETALSYAELDGVVNRVANGLTGLGVKKGDITGLMLERTPELIIAFLASIKAGAIPAPINFNLGKESLEKFLNTLRPRVLFTCEKFTGLIDSAQIPAGMLTVVTDGQKSAHPTLSELKKSAATKPAVEISSEDTAYLNYTSGSTGEQKGAVTTHANIYWNTKSAVEIFSITEDDTHLCMFAPFAHPHELFARALFTGGAMVLLNEVFPKSLARTIMEKGVTCMMGLAPMYEMLIEVAKGDGLATLRVPESGGMYTRPDIIEGFRKRFGVPVYTVWGSTETAGIAIANRPGEEIKGPSTGRPCPHYDVRLVDEEGADVKTGDVGELAFRGPAVVGGYYNIDGKKAGCFRDGWYFSGDLYRVDEEGYFFFVDRKSAMMKVAGLKVYPLEVEKVLFGHPAIKEAAVVSSVDGLKGEVPRAVIVSRDGKNIAKSDIHRFLRGKIENYKIPRVIEFMEELPRTPGGKINKKALTEKPVGGREG